MDWIHDHPRWTLIFSQLRSTPPSTLPKHLTTSLSGLNPVLTASPRLCGKKASTIQPPKILPPSPRYFPEQTIAFWTSFLLLFLCKASAFLPLYSQTPNSTYSFCLHQYVLSGESFSLHLLNSLYLPSSSPPHPTLTILNSVFL